MLTLAPFQVWASVSEPRPCTSVVKHHLFTPLGKPRDAESAGLSSLIISKMIITLFIRVPETAAPRIEDLDVMESDNVAHRNF